MEIINNSEKVMKRFDELLNGTVFIDQDGDVCMKTDNEDYNTVRLLDGMIFYTESEISCKVIKATLTIE